MTLEQELIAQPRPYPPVGLGVSPGWIWLFHSDVQEEVAAGSIPLRYFIYVHCDDDSSFRAANIERLQGKTGHYRIAEALSDKLPRKRLMWDILDALLAGVQVGTSDQRAFELVSEIVADIKSGHLETRDGQHYALNDDTLSGFRIFAPGEITIEPFRPVGPPRRSNRKIDKPTLENGLMRIPNVLNNGTRNLGFVLAGVSPWESDLNKRELTSTLNGQRAGRIVFGDGGENEARELAEQLGPRALKVAIAITSLILEKNRGRGVPYDPRYSIGATLTVGEVARVTGYVPDSHRTIDTEILRRVARDLLDISRVSIYAADGPFDRKTKRAPSGWVGSIIAITDVFVGQPGPNGEELPQEFHAVLGRTWAEAALDRYDVLQVVPGFMELKPARDDEAILLAWYYLTDFRYRMMRGERQYPMRIDRLCAAAQIEVDQPHSGRFLDRLEGWHKRLQDLGIIGSYARDPQPGADWPPRRILTEGTYRVTQPKALSDVYSQQKKLNGGPRKRKG